MEEIIKIGFDIHGVINEKPKFFASLGRLILEAGGEVHILSGPPKEQIVRELESLGLAGEYSMYPSYSHLFSIVDYHREIGTPMKQDSKGNWHLAGDDGNYLWDRTKGEYCLKHQIDLMIDDSDAYAYFFKTPFARFYSKTKRTWHVDVDKIDGPPTVTVVDTNNATMPISGEVKVTGSTIEVTTCKQDRKGFFDKAIVCGGFDEQFGDV